MSTESATGNDSWSSKIGNVQYPVADVARAVQFYQKAFHLDPRFIDGDRYAAIDAGGTTLGLAGPAEDITSGTPAAAFKVGDVTAALKAFIEEGGSIVREPQQGPHEVRAVAQDPWGNTVIIYGPK
ncbi:VOC family protein [Nocardia tengchongensis]|uniref:VOC family protein n=1 Tax=Nocardia tengchongensis TaxID=2055889 RepID=UPI0036AE0AF9